MCINVIKYNFNNIYMTNAIQDIKLPILKKDVLERLRVDLNLFLKQKSKIRRAVLSDFLTNSSYIDNIPAAQYEKPKHYRIQDEHGEKKFIKP